MAIAEKVTPGVRTELHVVVAQAHWHRVRELIAEGADINAADDKSRRPIHGAVNSLHSHSDFQALKLLLAAGADFNVEEHRGRTPLHYAAINNCPESKALLVEAGADQNIRDNDGRTAGFYELQSQPRLARAGGAAER